MLKQNYDVGIYVRLSKDDERAGESVSIENQKLMLRKYVTEQGWNEVGCYVDDGYSGTNFDRPGVARLIEDAKDGRINLILVKDLSRFGRNYIEIGRFTDYVFPMIGCRFIALNDGVDTIHNDNDIMPFRNLFNEFQSRDTSKKIKAVKQACARDGKFMGWCAPYGYQKDPADKHRFLIDAPAAAVVRRIFGWRCEGHGAKSIANFLNEESILPPRLHWAQRENRANNFQHNGLWNQITVQELLRNEAYIGNIVQCKVGTMSYKNQRTVRKPEEEWIRAEGMHEPIIDRATWDLCREIAEKNYRPRTTKDGHVTLFSGLLVCADCGSHMIHRPHVVTRKNGRKVTYRIYICGNYTRSGKLACTTHRITMEDITQLVLDDIRHYVGRAVCDEKALRQELKALKDQDSAARKKADRSQQKALVSRLNELERLTQSLYEDKVKGAIPEAVCQNLIQKYEAERVEKVAQLEEILQRLAQAEQDDNDVERFLEAVKRYVAIETLDREMLLELIDFIEIGQLAVQDDGKKSRDVTIHYKFVGKIA